jgi:hypothetical protein
MPGLYGGLYGQNLPYKFKIRMVISRIATSKNHIELLVPGQIWDWICDPEQILVLIRPSATSKPKVFGWRPAVLKRTDSTGTACLTKFSEDEAKFVPQFVSPQLHSKRSWIEISTLERLPGKNEILRRLECRKHDSKKPRLGKGS